MTTVVKNLIIINVLFFLGTSLYPEQFMHLFAGRWFQSADFRPWQIVTHMFMHGGVAHIFFNMFLLYQFGSALESFWGSKKFLIYYMACGIGAFFLFELVNFAQIYPLLNEATPEMLEAAKKGMYVTTSSLSAQLTSYFQSTVVGASGAVFGLLLAFGVLFPDTRLMLLFPPIPIKAKHLMLILGAIELYMGIQNNPGDNVAHFAHLGGMLIGYILIKYWDKKGNSNFQHFR